MNANSEIAVLNNVSIAPIIAPRGLSRTQAAKYIGISPSLFDAMVKDGRMPQPKLINSRCVWDRHKLDLAFDELPDKEGTPLALSNEWELMS